jgi:tetratricopeptide (TPR) repeat protein
MFRVTSPTKMDDRQLNRLIKRAVLLLVVGTIAFVGFYFMDRWRPATEPIVDRRLSALEQAVRDKPEDVVSRGQLADTYVAKARYDEALAQYNAILDSGKEEELATFGRAAAYMGLEQYDLAKKDYERVVEIAKVGEMAKVDPMLEAAYYRLGDIAMRQDRPADAIAPLEKALAIKRSDADAGFLIGKAYAAMGDTQKAETALRAAVAFDPMWNEPYAVLADIFSRTGKTAMAEWAGSMADVAAGKPDVAQARLLAIADDADAALDAAIGLGILYETQGDTASAGQWYGKALELAPANAAARLGMSRVGPVPAELPALPTPAMPGGATN